MTEQLPVGFTAVLVHVREIHTPRQPGVQRRLTSRGERCIAAAGELGFKHLRYMRYPPHISMADLSGTRGWVDVRANSWGPTWTCQYLFHAQVVRSLRLFKTSLHPQALAMPAFMRLRYAVVNALQ